jgi:flagellin
LSTGLRINSAKDDAAGLAISERFTTQIRGLNQAIRNANDGVSFAQTAEGALSTSGDALQRIRELAVQSINDTNSSSDRQALNNEVGQLIAEVNRIANSTQFNGQNILDGSSSTLTFQVGANQNQTIQVDGVDSRTSQLGARISTSASFTSTQIAALTTVTLNGNAIDLSAATTTQDILDGINGVAATTGVQALKATSTSTAAAGLAITTTGVVSINSVAVTVTNGNATATADAINAVSTQTGVTATINGAAIVLANSDGSNIVVDNTGTGQLGAVATTETFQAGVTLAGAVSEGAFTATGGVGTDVEAALLGAATQADNTLTGVDVLTGANANDALLTLDFALQQVSGLRAELGAVQTRFESTISNLSITSENLEAARSRIRDADFAAETAELTRSQILQQAGIAILSQANAQPQNVLALLQ